MGKAWEWIKESNKAFLFGIMGFVTVVAFQSDFPLFWNRKSKFAWWVDFTRLVIFAFLLKFLVEHVIVLPNVLPHAPPSCQDLFLFMLHQACCKDALIYLGNRVPKILKFHIIPIFKMAFLPFQFVFEWREF